MAKPMTEPLSRLWRPTNYDIGRTPRTVRRRAGEPERQRGASESVRTFAPAGIGSSPKAVAIETFITTTTRDADTAGDGPAVRHELTLADTGRLPDRGSKPLDSRKIHKHK